ncbi:DNA polymerase III subunit beta [Nitrosospira sp. Nsp13]|jgi:DNA polymerase-3 subunit beta|uniref:DNA polymerase III subunit beta n=1 Tax=Nitrosospira sp. Nsp13 TaxID=1855332 RepID=UPI00088E1026|nr:DNA polymerase III subunit beta [Nitrosospira sp. Nsp13]SCY29130.1 DNA polymerase III, beta subunit [Nitrosospira sp. Nsp13]
MKLIQADKDILLKPLQTVTGIVERRHTLPILSNVLIERKNDEISFIATDLEIQITTSTRDSNTVTEGHSVTVAAKKLQDILRALPDKTEVTLETKENRLQGKAGKSRFSLQTLPVEDFPKFPENTESQAKITVKQKELKHLLFLVQYAMAQQDIRYYLNGLLLLMEENHLKAVATDGHRLAFALLALETPQEKREVILPRKVVLELAKQLNDSDEPITVEILQNQIRFIFSSVILISKVVDGKFPDYNRVIPVDHQKQIDINRLLLLQTLQRASILSNEKFRGVRLILTTGNLRIVCNNAEQEEAEEELEVQYDGEALDIGFNVTYLLDVLNNLTSETVRCSFGDANSSALITIPGNEDFKYVVMPMRI